jgi:hypothetical protein
MGPPFMPDLIDFKRFTNNPALKGREEKFLTIDIKVAPVLASWQESLFAHEWLTQHGTIKPPKDMSAPLKSRRDAMIALIQGQGPLERPVLGIGIMDNIEIGAGKDLFLSLAALGHTVISVHIPKSHENDFRLFIRE